MLTSLNSDEPEVSGDFPIALQLAGKRFMDEEVLAAASVLDNIFKGGR